MIDRVVFDCMVILQGAASSTGPAAACLRLAEADRVEHFVSKSVLAEIRDVMMRPKVRKKFPVLTAEFVESFLRKLVDTSFVVDDAPLAYALPRDPKDEKYLNLAVAVNAKWLVSRDGDLLDLMNPESAEGSAFRARFPNLTILEPQHFLQSRGMQ